MSHDFSTPEGRFAAAEALGQDYNAAFLAWRKSLVVATVNGRDIAPVATGYGRLFQIEGTGRAFRTLEQATAYAEGLESK